MNDILRTEGLDAVRERHDTAKNYRVRPESKERVSPKNYMLPPPTRPMAVAREFVDECGLSDACEPTIRHWRGGWLAWRQSHWQEIDDREMRSLLYKYTENAIYLNAKQEVVPWAPNRHRVGDLVEALSAITLLPADINQ